jgi:glycogen operon protein
MDSRLSLEAGAAYPLGASCDGRGVNFALFSSTAERVELCLFEEPDGPEGARLELPRRTGDVWHGYLPGAAPGLLYGFRVHGPWRPEEGLRFDPSKLLVDPHARALTGPVVWSEALCARPDGDAALEDTAPYVPRGVVVDPDFDWGDDARPGIPWSRTVLYECHVKGQTMRHPGVPPEHRGRYLGLTAPAVIEGFRSLGVTALSLLPVQHAAIDAHLGRLGMPNYWGYGTLGFFAPDSRFASGALGEQLDEFRAMVRALHAAGLEVILDVVYNHTPETDPRGATLCLRGIDDRAYYRRDPERPGEYQDFTGCGNTLDLRSAPALELVLESLRTWVRDMHVDGFRFDLAPALVRGDDGRIDPEMPLFARIADDPLLSQVKIVVEPWDLGPDPECFGAFPRGVAQWNGRYRDAVRRFWCGDPHARAELASAFAGSSAVFVPRGRTPQDGVNFVTCHDGFPLADLVSYSHKRNEANGEANRDGRNGEPAWHFGAEGPSNDPVVLRARERVRRSLMATLSLSLGVPMLSHGDEWGRTQRGNNNAYCHDSELTWIDWTPLPEREAFRDFLQRAFALRRGNAVFRRRRHFAGETVGGAGVRDIAWFRPDGGEMEPHDWAAPGHALAIWLAAEGADERDEEGEPLIARSALLLLNGGYQPVWFRLPKPPRPGRWLSRLDTAGPAPPDGLSTSRQRVRAHSLVLMEWEDEA